MRAAARRLLTRAWALRAASTMAVVRSPRTASPAAAPASGFSRPVTDSGSG